MAINKVEFGGETLIDLTTDTVSPSSLIEGVTAHNAAGESITGEVNLSGFKNIYYNIQELGLQGDVTVAQVCRAMPVSSRGYFAYLKPDGVYIIEKDMLGYCHIVFLSDNGKEAKVYEIRSYEDDDEMFVSYDLMTSQNLPFYTSPHQLNLTNEESTLSAFYNAMPGHSHAVVDCDTVQVTSPVNTGTIVIEKFGRLRASIMLYDKGSNGIWKMKLDGEGQIQDNGWVRIYTAENLVNATTSAAGLMSSTDKSRLDTINGNYSKALALNGYTATHTFTSGETYHPTFTQTKSGYTPLAVIWRGSSTYSIYPVRLDWTASNGKCVIDAYVKYTATNSASYSLFYSIIWIKN